MAKEKKIYLNFPVSMIPPIYVDEDVVNAINNIIRYAIMAFIKQRKATMTEAGAFLGITIGSSLEELTKVYDKFHDSTRVMTSIDRSRAFALRDARKSYKDNRDEIIALCGELAIRSIVGVKDYAKCFRNLVLSRMAGFAKVIDETKYPQAIARLSGDGGKRQWRKMIKSLRYAGIAIYAPKGCHGFYASFRLSPLELAESIERKSRGHRQGTQYKTEYDLSNEELRRRALVKMGNVPHN